MNAVEQLWLPCTKKERADIQFVCPKCGKRDFRVFLIASPRYWFRGTGFHEIRCTICRFWAWLDKWDDDTVLK